MLFHISFRCEERDTKIFLKRVCIVAFEEINLSYEVCAHTELLIVVTWMCGFCSNWNSSLHSGKTCVLVDSKSRTSMSMSIEFDSTGKNLSSLTLLRILLWTFTRAFSSLDCSSSLRNPNSSSVQLGISDLFSCSEFSNLDNAEIKKRMRLMMWREHIITYKSG